MEEKDFISIVDGEYTEDSTWTEALKGKKYNYKQNNFWGQSTRRDYYLRKEKEDNIEKWRVNFVGFLAAKQEQGEKVIYVSFPKGYTNNTNINLEDIKKLGKILIDYLNSKVNNQEKPFLEYLEELINTKKTCDSVNKNGFCPLIIVKFEAIFEWMIGKYYGNGIDFIASNSSTKTVAYNSDILSKKIDDINNPQYWSYKWIPQGEESNNNSDIWQLDQQKKINIPDVVWDLEKKNICVIIDAKYYKASNDNAKTIYELPGNESVYKQYFYQEQFARIYKQFDRSVKIYNVFMLPYHRNNTKEEKTAVNPWGAIQFYTIGGTNNKSIGIFMVDILTMIEELMDETDLKKERKELLISFFEDRLNNSPVKPFIVGENNASTNNKN